MTAEARPRLSVPAKVRLAGEVVTSYRRAKQLVKTNDLPTVLRELRSDAADGGAVPLPVALRLGRAVARTLAVLPADSRCLMRSLVLTRMLARRGAAGVLVIGVRPGEKFGAHAWVELAGQPLLATGEGEFARLVEL